METPHDSAATALSGDPDGSERRGGTTSVGGPLRNRPHRNLLGGCSTCFGGGSLARSGRTLRRLFGARGFAGNAVLCKQERLHLVEHQRMLVEVGARVFTPLADA